MFRCRGGSRSGASVRCRANLGLELQQNLHPVELIAIHVYLCSMHLRSAGVAAGRRRPVEAHVVFDGLDRDLFAADCRSIFIVMNDKHFVGEYGNGFASNGVVLFVITLAFVLGVVSIPLEFFVS